MVGPFTLDYLLFVFLAALGVLQMVASYTALRGLLLIRCRPVAFLAGFVVTVLAFIWFFISEPRNLPDTEGGLDGNQLAGLFAVGAGSALILTLLLSSLRNRTMGGGERQFNLGLDALRETTYLKALRCTLKDRWTRYRTLTRK